MTLGLDLRQNYIVRTGIIALRRRAVTFDSILLVFVTMADAAWTVYLVGRGLAVEANPFMAQVLHYGPIAFVTVKLLYTMPLIVVCEWLREFRPQFATAALRITLIMYLALYAFGEMRLHGLL
jgi:hypothetical protein